MKEYIDNAMTFAEYIKLIDDLLLDGKTTGPNQSEAMVGYGKLNRQRMHRLEKTVTLNDPLIARAKNVGSRWIWLVITEGWCGDAAQNIPIIEKIAAENPNIETRYILRDENLELMDKYLTNGARSIPKLIALDAETLREIGTWGPRPQPAMDLFHELRDLGLDKSAIMESIQRWYIGDKNQTLQHEFEELIAKWSESVKSSAFSTAGLSRTFGGLF